MRAATIAALFGEGILVTLNATKLIMYWGGVTSIIISNPPHFVHTQNSQISQIHHSIFVYFSQSIIP